MMRRKNAKNPPKKLTTRSRILRAVIAVLILLVGISLVTYTTIQIEHANARAGMRAYLEEKYGQNFVVENYRVEGAGIAIEGDPRADAYPEHNRSLRFTVTDIGQYKIGSHNYWDSYPERIWEQEVSEEVQGIVKGAFDDDIRLKISLSGSLPVIRSIQGSVPRYDVAFKEYGKEIYMTIQIIEGGEYDDLSQRLYRVMSDLRRFGVSLYLNYKDARNYVSIDGLAIDTIGSAKDIDKYIERRKE